MRLEMPKWLPKRFIDDDSLNICLRAQPQKKQQHTQETVELLRLHHQRHLPSTARQPPLPSKKRIWWYPSLTPKISRQMPDKCPDIYQSTISSLSCFSPIHAAADNTSLPLIPSVWMPAECHTSFQTGCRCASCQTHVQRAPPSMHARLQACALESEPYPERDKSNPLPGRGSGQLNRWHSQRLLMNFPFWQGASFRPVAKQKSVWHFKASRKLGNQQSVF